MLPILGAGLQESKTLRTQAKSYSRSLPTLPRLLTQYLAKLNQEGFLEGFTAFHEALSTSVSISNFTKQKTMSEILVSTREAYGTTYVDVVNDEQRIPLQSLTGNSTLTQSNINALKKLGFTFKLQATTPDINF